MTLRRIVFASISLAACANPIAAQSDAYRRCMEYPYLNPDFAIQECSAAIQSGILSGQQLADAFNNRGELFDQKGDHDRAMRDFDQAIRLNPDLGEAFNNRGLANLHMGDDDRRSAIKVSDASTGGRSLHVRSRERTITQ